MDLAGHRCDPCPPQRPAPVPPMIPPAPGDETTSDYMQHPAAGSAPPFCNDPQLVGQYEILSGTVAEGYLIEQRAHGVSDSPQTHPAWLRERNRGAERNEWKCLVLTGWRTETGDIDWKAFAVSLRTTLNWYGKLRNERTWAPASFKLKRAPYYDHTAERQNVVAYMKVTVTMTYDHADFARSLMDEYIMWKHNNIISDRFYDVLAVSSYYGVSHICIDWARGNGRKPRVNKFN